LIALGPTSALTRHKKAAKSRGLLFAAHEVSGAASGKTLSSKAQMQNRCAAHLQTYQQRGTKRHGKITPPLSRGAIQSGGKTFPDGTLPEALPLAVPSHA
jgi:hypothetical protein